MKALGDITGAIVDAALKTAATLEEGLHRFVNKLPTSAPALEPSSRESRKKAPRTAPPNSGKDGETTMKAALCDY